MNEPARLAGSEYLIAVCGHAIRPGEEYVVDEITGDVRCAWCADEPYREVLYRWIDEDLKRLFAASQ